MTTPLKVLVVDDEPLARRRLLRMLQRIGGALAVGEARDGQQALELIRTLGPDVVLLDIRMPGLDGLELARTARDLPPVIFTTAHDEHAVAAFEANAVDYLLKPIEQQRLEQALARVAQRRVASDPQQVLRAVEQLLAAHADAPATARLTARHGTTVHLVDPRAVSRFRATDKCTVFLHAGRELVLDDSLTTLQARLGPLGFLRVHRSELVNLHRVRALHARDGGFELELEGGEAAPVSRRMIGELKQRLGIA